ncbi:MAG: hypothetical protein AB7L41_05720 [Flavobacteriaceae bacterium]
MSRQALTVLSVVFDTDAFLRRNVELTRRLNPDAAYRWLVVDNGEPAALSGGVPGGVEILPGVARPLATRDSGSLHHALALQSALSRVDTRYLLILDHDFLAVREGWIASLLADVEARRIAIFGAPWNPRWFYQYRGFPSAQFMLIDTALLPLRDVDLLPAIADDRFWQFVNDDRRPIPRFLRDTLKAGRLRDTGWRLGREARRRGLNIGLLTPSYVPPDTPRARFERAVAPLLPRALSVYPRPGDGHTERRFLPDLSAETADAGVEEFFWRDEPFAVHFRRVGRRMAGDPVTRDEEALRRLCAALGLADAAP